MTSLSNKVTPFPHVFLVFTLLLMKNGGSMVVKLLCCKNLHVLPSIIQKFLLWVTLKVI